MKNVFKTNKQFGESRQRPPLDKFINVCGRFLWMLLWEHSTVFFFVNDVFDFLIRICIIKCMCVCVCKGEGCRFYMWFGFYAFFFVWFSNNMVGKIIGLTGPRLSNPLRVATSWAWSLSMLRWKRTRNELVKTSLRCDDAAASGLLTNGTEENRDAADDVDRTNWVHCTSSPKRHSQVNCIARFALSIPNALAFSLEIVNSLYCW